MADITQKNTKGKPSEEMYARNRQMYEMYVSPSKPTYKQVGAEYGVTAQRAEKIIKAFMKKYLGKKFSRE